MIAVIYVTELKRNSSSSSFTRCVSIFCSKKCGCSGKFEM